MLEIIGEYIMDKFYKYFAFKAFICFVGFIVSALALGDQSLTLFWVAMMSTVASLGFYFAKE
jgi:hypothetical protein